MFSSIIPMYPHISLLKLRNVIPISPRFSLLKLSNFIPIYPRFSLLKLSNFIPMYPRFYLLKLRNFTPISSRSPLFKAQELSSKPGCQDIWKNKEEWMRKAKESRYILLLPEFLGYRGSYRIYRVKGFRVMEFNLRYHIGETPFYYLYLL